MGGALLVGGVSRVSGASRVDPRSAVRRVMRARGTAMRWEEVKNIGGPGMAEDHREGGRRGRGGRTNGEPAGVL